MKRFHIHLGVENLDESIRFYSGLFGAPPSVQKPDYAKWMVDDPRLNFAISRRGGHAGVNHLGLQADSADELADLATRFAVADARTAVAETQAHCCYAVSDKHWVQDPQGVAWEAFHTLDSIPVFGVEAIRQARQATIGGCCSPTARAQPTSPAGAAQSDCHAPTTAEAGVDPAQRKTGCCA